MEELNLEKLKVDPGDPVREEDLNKVVDAMIEIRESLMEHAKHPGLRFRKVKRK